MAKTVGQNLKDLRESRHPKVTQEALAKRLKLKRPAQVSLLESSRALPKPETIAKLAEAMSAELGRTVEPKELLHDVETPYDLLRAGKPIVTKRKTARSRAPTDLRAAK